MKLKRFTMVLFVAVICFTLAGTSYAKYRPAKPFAGKFKGTIVSNDVTYTVIYKIKQSGSELSGTANTMLNGEVVLPLEFTGTAESKIAEIVLNIQGGSPKDAGYTPSDKVKITLRKKGKKGLFMKYIDEETSEGIGSKVTYKRLK